MHITAYRACGSVLDYHPYDNSEIFFLVRVKTFNLYLSDTCALCIQRYPPSLACDMVTKYDNDYRPSYRVQNDVVTEDFSGMDVQRTL